MIRSLEGQDFNRIANDPSVKPYLAFASEGAVDLAPVVSNPENVCLLTPCRNGGYILLKLQPGLYQAHTLALPSARGAPMADLMRDGFRFLFLETDCIEVCTAVPDGAKRADRWADIAGFREGFRRDGCMTLNGVRVGASFRSITYNEWLMRDEQALEMGRLFHARLEAQGSHVDHAEDEIHDRWVGATLSACLHGNVPKGIGLYNRWAVQAGYAQASVLSLQPPLVDIGTALIQSRSGGFEVLKATPPPSSDYAGGS